MSMHYPPPENCIKNSNKKSRLFYIDNLRVLACFLVILTHSAMPARDSAEGIWLYTVSFIASPSSELFLALSGTVLLPVHTDTVTFYKKRFLKLLPPVIFWSIVGMLLYIPLFGYTLTDSLYKILRIPLEPVIGVYWFVYVMIGLYLFAPIISAYLETASKSQLKFFLLLWSITLLMPYLYMAIGDRFNQSGSHYWMLNYFGGFIGYWVMGHYFNKYPLKIGANKYWITLIILSSAYPLFLFFLKTKNISTNDLLDNLQFGSAVLVALLYTIFQNIHLKTKIQNIITKIAKFSFGIYLIHFYIIRFVWSFFENSFLHTLPKTFLIAFITMALSWCIVWIISKLPYGKYVTGS